MMAAAAHVCPLSPLAPLPRRTADLLGIGGQIRVEIEDFVVEEIPLYLPSGAGDHLYLWVEKRDLSGPMLRRRLGELLGIDAGDIGMAGLKDRRAVTRQWISVPMRPGLDPDRVRDGRIAVLQAARHNNKLRTGHLAGNRFIIRVRGVDASDPAALRARIDAKITAMRAGGMPNFYGDQRMGHGGSTLAAGWALAQGLDGRVRVQSPDGAAHQIQLRDRQLRRLAASALQAELFNRVVAERMRQGLLDRVLAGDYCRKTDTGGSFVTDDRGREQERLDRGEVEITGPMWGPKMARPGADAAELETSVLLASGLDEAMFRRIGPLAAGTRRPVAVRPDDLSAEIDGESVVLRFGLPAGSFATVLLHEIQGPHPDVDRAPQGDETGEGEAEDHEVVCA